MTKLFRVIAIVVLTIAAFGGTVAAYDGAKKEIILIDGDEEKSYTTKTRTVEEFLEENGIIVYEDDRIDKSMLYYTEDGDTITIDRAPTVVINVNGVPRMVRTNAQTVGEVLEEMDDKIGEDYKLEGVTEDDKVTDNSVIVVHLPKEIITSRQIDVAYETEYIEEPSMLVGQEKVVQEGVNGKSIITLKETYIDDEVVSSEEMNSEVITEPVKAIVKKGTSYGNNDSIDVSSLSYSKKMTVQATGYTPYDPGCNGITASGTKAEKGVIAVDPKVIPMGSKVYIPGYGIAIAEDTGGAIKGNKIDLCYEKTKEAFAWGRRTVDIYILD